MAGLVPAIHDLLGCTKGVDAWHKVGHDGGEIGASQLKNAVACPAGSRMQSGPFLPLLNSAIG
jgi:hypothetical protein